MDNVGTFLYNLFFTIWSGANAVYGFLTTEIDVIGIKISVLGLLGGVGLVAVLIAVIVKNIAPLA